MTHRAIFGFISWLWLVCAVAAQTLTFPALSGRVVDDASLFDAAGRAALTETLAALETKTTDQLVVVTLKSLQGTSVDDYGYQLGRQWQIGQKDKNTGVLLIVVPSERKVRIEVGYGLEGVLTDALTKVIIENAILPQFKAGDYAGGIKSGVDDIARVLGGDAADLQRQAAQGTLPNAAKPQTRMPLWLIVVLAIGGIGVFGYCTVKGGSLCQALIQILFVMLLSRGAGGSSKRG